ncbi:MAG: TetR/AcrR family transcriptional regulator [Acidimicrobiaceae bacterium]|nr:TetR/AcrR family transcriptional regulator [Acidimicrobiaceae bacterium]MDQ1446647.1 TetR/AcrR family transcriptional regulator [Acidimicrobiaceae bacterium]
MAAPPITPTNERILDTALTSFGNRGYDVTSLDDLANTLGIRKQTILYWFPSKEALLGAVIDQSAAELSGVLERTLDRAGPGWERVEAIVKSVFRMAARRPELLGLVREVSRLGPPASTRLLDGLQPLLGRATGFLEAEMRAGRMRKQDPRVVLLAAYSAVLGMATEVEVLRAMGFDPSARDLVRRRKQLLEFLRSAVGVADDSGYRLRAGGV